MFSKEEKITYPQLIVLAITMFKSLVANTQYNTQMIYYRIVHFKPM